MKVKIINGANLNMLGMRGEMYGNFTLSEMEKEIADFAATIGVEVSFFQSNYEGEIIDEIHKATTGIDAVIINAGAYSHYSYAIADALEILKIPKIEVHLTDISRREDFRKISVTARAADHCIMGLGIEGYKQALQKAKELCKK